MHVNTARGWRGGERQILWLTERLNAMGVTSLVATRPNEPLGAELRARGLPLVPFEPLGEWDVRAIAKLRRHAGKAGINILNAHDGHANTIAALATRRTQKLVITRRVHQPITRNFVSRWKYIRAAGVIAISNLVARIVEEAGVPRERIHVVHSGVPLDRRVEPASRETLAALAVPPGAPLVVMVGALVGHKDPLNFVRAIRVAREAVPDLKALLVGRGSMRPVIESEISRLGLEQTLLLTGHRTDADALMAAASVAVLSSREEGLGTVVLDAMQLSIPVVATATSAIVDVIRDGVDGLLAPVGDSAALGHRIVEVLSRDSTPLVERARRRVAEFSADATAAKTLAVYQHILRA